MTACPFCLIVAGTAPVHLVAQWPNVWAITPLNPVTPWHTLFIPTVHVEDFTTDPAVSSSVMLRAAQYAAEFGGDCNLITSKGKDATQSVFHLHVHLVPRRAGDGLALPWTAPVAPADPTALQSRSASVPPEYAHEITGGRWCLHLIDGTQQITEGRPSLTRAAAPPDSDGRSAAGSAPPG